MRFDTTANFDELDIEERELNARRIQTYSKEALKKGIQVNDITVNHPSFVAGLAAADRIFQLSKEIELAQGMRLIGPTGSGKTRLAKVFRDSLPSSSLFTKGMGCICVRASEKPSGGQLIGSLLRAYKYPFSGASGKTFYTRMWTLCDLIQANGTRIIVVDKAEHLTQNRRQPKGLIVEPEPTTALCELMDSTKVGIVLAGSDALDQLEAVDPHLADRVSVRIALSHFEPNAEWLGLLKSMAGQCNWIDINLVYEAPTAKLLHIATGGNIRQLKRLLVESVLVAAQAASGAVSRVHLNVAFSAVYGASCLRTNPFV